MNALELCCWLLLLVSHQQNIVADVLQAKCEFAEPWPKTDFSTFQVSQNTSRLDVRRKLPTCKNAFLIQKMITCWCPEGTAGKASDWWRSGDAESVPIRGAKDTERHHAPTDYGVWGNVISSPCRVRDVAPTENGFSSFNASRNVSVCRILTSCQKTFINGDER